MLFSTKSCMTFGFGCDVKNITYSKLNIFLTSEFNQGYLEACVEPSRISMIELYCKKINGLKPLAIFAKKLPYRCLSGF